MIKQVIVICKDLRMRRGKEIQPGFFAPVGLRYQGTRDLHDSHHRESNQEVLP